MYSAIRSLYTSIRIPEEARKLTWMPVSGASGAAEKQRLIAELTQSNYIDTPTALNHFSQIDQYAVWKYGFFQLDMWDTPMALEGWRRKMPFLLRRLETLRQYYGREKSIRFVCVPLDVPRQLPVNPGKCLDKQHVNGGYTYLHGNTVYLFRREELPKVILHEYLHQIQGHKDLEWSQGSMDALQQATGVSIPDMRPNESIVEYWAWKHHWIFISIETGIPWKVLWKAETHYVLRQARRIWNHQKQCASSWMEGTPVFSYYILKAMYVGMGGNKKSILPWRLDYSVPELNQWIHSHWIEWKKQLETIEPTKEKHTSARVAREAREARTARMTLLGDF